jgi:hypothetical protein
MAQTIERRVDALEVSHGIGGGGRCPECGGLPDEPDPDDTFELVFVAPEEDDEEDTFCGRCGRPLTFASIRFPDDIA